MEYLYFNTCVILNVFYICYSYFSIVCFLNYCQYPLYKMTMCCFCYFFRYYTYLSLCFIIFALIKQHYNTKTLKQWNYKKHLSLFSDIFLTKKRIALRLAWLEDNKVCLETYLHIIYFIFIIDVVEAVMCRTRYLPWTSGVFRELVRPVQKSFLKNVKSWGQRWIMASKFKLNKFMPL